MNTLKRFFAFALAFLMTLAFWGCESTVEDFSSSTPEDAVINYYKAFEEKNTQAFIANTSKAKFVNMGTTEDYAKEIIEYALSEFESAYGKNIKFEIKVTEVDYLSTIDLARIQQEYTETEALSGLEVKDGANVTFDIKIKGDSAEKTGVGEACVIHENGSWKMYALELHI